MVKKQNSNYKYSECIKQKKFHLKGFKNIKKDISAMIGTKYTDHFTFYWWQISWTITTPLLLMVKNLNTFFSLKLITCFKKIIIKILIIFSWVDSGPLSVGDYEFPYWSDIFGNIISAASTVGAVVWAIYLIYDAIKNKKVYSNPIKISKYYLIR